MTFMFKPLGGRVVFAYEHRVDRIIKTKHIELHRSAPEFEGIPNRGLAVAVADDVKEIQVGKSYYFTDSSPVGIEIEGQKYLFIHKDSVTAEVDE